MIPFSTRARIISVASGKGGAGKTNVSVNLAVALAQAGDRTLLIDCDMGLANAAIVLGMPSAWTIGDLLAGRCGVDDLLQTGPAGLRFLPGHSGTGTGSTLSAAERARLMEALEPHLADYDQVVIDTGGGLEASSLALVASADTPLIVLTPEPTSFVDAYAVVKALHVAHGTAGFDIICNMVRHDVAARQLFDRFKSIAGRFLDIELNYLGAVPADNYVREAVLRKRCVVETFPGAPASRAFGALARRLAAPVAAMPPERIFAEVSHGAH